ncbi:Uncharacterised protein [Serratia fonticola]|uniref:Uncharacterized protein n=1 Tax=Serratia fonticola TaxID=47917 RepID=A0A4U9USN6_SERFO|nr:Uncharacterised protein [Serratia fonticola]
MLRPSWIINRLPELAVPLLLQSLPQGEGAGSELCSDAGVVLWHTADKRQQNQTVGVLHAAPVWIINRLPELAVPLLLQSLPQGEGAGSELGSGAGVVLWHTADKRQQNQTVGAHAAPVWIINRLPELAVPLLLQSLPQGEGAGTGVRLRCRSRSLAYC